jgi:lipopolysaccharide transport system permease protein
MFNIKQKSINKPIVITSPKSFELPDFKEVWEARDLLFYLVERDLKVRFQQTFIGVLWIALQPIIMVLIFYIVLGILVKVPTGDVPYPIFFLSGFVVWQLFNQIVNSSAASLTGNIGVISKSYFPRLILPLSTTVGSLIDFLVSFIILLVLMATNSYPITARFLLLPFLVLLTMLFSSGIGLLFGALTVTFRDMKNLLGFIMMIWMYLTPIMYPASLVPENYQILLSINPLSSLIDSYRWVFLNSGTLPPPINFLISLIVMVILWLLGAILFRSMENKIADVM